VIVGQIWSSDDYEKNARFVSDFGVSLIDWLDPKPSETLCDLGCGDGCLTVKIAEKAGKVIGVDASDGFVECARQRGIDARCLNAVDMAFDQAFDAVFSNAALHWMKPPELVAERVFSALRPGGRFVAEMGGFGNVAAIHTALHAICHRCGLDPVELDPWYFPTLEAHSTLLEEAGFAVERIETFARPTALPGDITGWIDTMAGAFLTAMDLERRAESNELLRRWLAPALCDHHGQWTADYVRLRFIARRPA
jgi:trans-aconitate methyltransferase